MEFNSQVATSVEQSKRLLELGLKKETADMCYTDAALPFVKNSLHLEAKSYVEVVKNTIQLSPFTFIPAWSLHRLIELMYKGDMFGFVSLTTHNRNIDTIYELVIANIDGLIKIKRFNPEYLEEKL